MAEAVPTTTDPAVLDPAFVHLDPEVYTPQTEEELKKYLQLQVADVSNVVRDEAADSADEYLRQQTTEQGVKGFLKKIWYGNLARDFIRQRELRRNERTIISEQNAYTHSGGTRADHDRAMGAVIQRLTSEYDLLHEGEKNEAAADVRHGQRLEDSLKLIVGAFARGDMDYDSLGEEKARLLTFFGSGQRAADRRKGLIYADNVIEVARNARAAFEHGVGLDAIDQALGLKVADVKLGVRTAASNELADRIIDKAYSSSVGSLVNETVLATAVAVGIGTSKFTVRKIATAIGATVGIGVGAAGVAAVRESHHVKQERRLHSRQMAEGGVINDTDSKRRQKLEATRYETVSAVDIIDQLNQQIGIAAEDENPTTLADLISIITEARLRINISAEEGVDLISYSSKLDVEQQRLELGIALARAQTKLFERDASSQSQALNDAGVDEAWLEAAIDSNYQQVIDRLDAGMEQKDALFNRLKHQRMLASAAIGLVVGVTIGEASQEIRSTIDDSLKGLFSHDSASQNRTTELAAIFHHGDKISLHKHADELPLGAEASFFQVGHHAFDLPKGYHIVDGGAKEGINLVGPDGKIVAAHLVINKDGQFGESTTKLLDEKGFKLHVTHGKYVTTKTISRVEAVKAQDYIAAHPKEFTTVHRELWYDNDTPYPDKNELETWWGGQNYSGIDAQGNFVLNVSHMTPGGSFEGNQSVDYAQLLASNKLGLAVSLTRADQTHVVLLHFNADGNVIIPAHDPSLSSVFINKDGHAEFIGAYAEVVQIGDTGPNGTAINMLGTLVGTNEPHTINQTVNTLVHTTERSSTTHITAPLEKTTVTETSTALPIEVAPAIPLRARSGLEDLAASDNEGGYYNYYTGTPRRESYVFGSSFIHEQRRRAAESRRGLIPLAPELEDDPDADVDIGVITQRYLSSMASSRKRQVGELRRKLDKQPKAEHPKVVVVIPVAAHQEGKNIYQTLTQYGLQRNVDFEDVEIVTFANYPEGAKRDRTIREIKRFQRNNPNVKVRLLEQQLPLGEALIGNIRGLATDSVLQDLIARGISLDEVILVSNDADSQWISPSYIRTIMDQARDNRNTDAFLGFIDWSFEAYKAHPEILVSTRFMQMLEIYIRRSQGAIGSSGANFAFRPKIFMAAGGYHSKTGLAEDVQLGRMIKTIRNGAVARQPIAYLGRQSEINTNARRALAKLFKDGGAAAEQWDDSFGPNDELRNRDFNLSAIDLTDSASRDTFLATVERQLNATFRIYKSSFISSNSRYQPGSALNYFDNETIRQVNRMLYMIGVNVKWQTDGTFKITSSDRMIKNIERWRSEH